MESTAWCTSSWRKCSEDQALEVLRPSAAATRSGALRAAFAFVPALDHGLRGPRGGTAKPVRRAVPGPPASRARLSCGAQPVRRSPWRRAYVQQRSHDYAAPRRPRCFGRVSEPLLRWGAPSRASLPRHCWARQFANAILNVSFRCTASPRTDATADIRGLAASKRVVREAEQPGQRAVLPETQRSVPRKHRRPAAAAHGASWHRECAFCANCFDRASPDRRAAAPARVPAPLLRVHHRVVICVVRYL